MSASSRIGDPVTPGLVSNSEILSPSRPELPPSPMMMRSEASSAGSGVAASRCMTNTPELSTMSWVRLYLFRLIRPRGASGTIAAAPADSEISPLARPWSTVVTATGNGRRPDSVYSAAFRSSVMLGDPLYSYWHLVRVAEVGPGDGVGVERGGRARPGDGAPGHQVRGVGHLQRPADVLLAH